MSARMAIWMIAAASGAALAAFAAPTIPDTFARFADPQGVVLAVTADFGAGGAVRLAVYGDEQAFLERAEAKHEARLDDNGLAIVPLGALSPGTYAFVAYFDENGDGKLNRGALGRPKEPIAFSNGVRPKLRKPRFDEAKVEVNRGSVVVLAFED